jgi:hypothetical protein
VLLGAQLLPWLLIGADLKRVRLSTALALWFGRCYREAGVAVDAGAARANFLGLQLLFSVVVAMVVIIFSGAAVEVSWSATTVFLVARLGGGGSVCSSSPTCIR